MDDTDTWYVLADGTHAHPADVEQGEDGILKHKNGAHVVLRENGLPLTSGVAAKGNKQSSRANKAAEVKAAEAKAAEAKAADAKAAEAKANAMKPGDQQSAGYATRESKAQ